ncbi:chromosome partition protein MukB, partial [bacterium]|nr:chromosome partition protein MukB [bacterium]
INQVIPVDLQTSDPEKAQDAIGQKLQSLEQNLEQQERSLRQHVQNIPAHIHAKIRKEKSRIRQLNQKLEAVRFGFLQTIRINIETQPKLKAFLDVLPQQLDFFTETGSENVPVETLMANLYEEMGAGKVKGDQLLDYRHYVRLNIEVKREGTEDFEKVTSTNLSTGESIGVGIAVLIMVLMSWEDQANLLRNTEQSSSLRFLLLDESSRLDQKALYTLNDFCQNMELQLLIAAPSVEKTLRGTTHHLTRGYYDGREEVIVRGRRLN